MHRQFLRLHDNGHGIPRGFRSATGGGAWDPTPPPVEERENSVLDRVGHPGTRSRDPPPCGVLTSGRVVIPSWPPLMQAFAWRHSSPVATTNWGRTSVVIAHNLDVVVQVANQVVVMGRVRALEEAAVADPDARPCAVHLLSVPGHHLDA